MTRLTEAQCYATAIEWDAFLGSNGVPRERYWECFELFMRHERQNKFTVYDLRDSWRKIKDKYSNRGTGITEEEARCGGCYGTGWAFNELVPLEGGQRWEKIEGGVRPCICSKGERYRRSFELASEDNQKMRRDSGIDRLEKR